VELLADKKRSYVFPQEVFDDIVTYLKAPGDKKPRMDPKIIRKCKGLQLVNFPGLGIVDRLMTLPKPGSGDIKRVVSIPEMFDVLYKVHCGETIHAGRDKTVRNVQKVPYLACTIYLIPYTLYI
jgi:hypothetical protein